MTTNEYIDVATYGRNSDKKQHTSQGIQADVFQQFATDPAGFISLFGKPARIVENYKDDGKSASKVKSIRADFNRMLNDVATGKHKVVLVLNTSRFSRLHPIDTAVFLKTFRDAGCRLVSIEDREVINVDDLGGLLKTMVKSSADHEYVRSLSANVLRGTIRSIRNHATAHVSIIPYGMAKLVVSPTGEQHLCDRTNNYCVGKDWKAYLVRGDETEVEVVRWIFDTYLASDISFCEIARRLNHHKDPKVRAGYGGKGWDDCRIKKILTNRHYRGQEFIGVDGDGEHYRVVDGQAVATKLAVGKPSNPVIVDLPANIREEYPPVVDPDVFERAQQKLRRKKGSRPKTKTTDGYALTGSVVCGHCGHKMVITTGGKFVCKTGRSGKTTCRQWGVREVEVLPWLIARIDKELLKRLQDKPKVPDDVDRDGVRQQIRNLDTKLGAIRSQLSDPSTTVEACLTLTAALNTLTTEKERLQSQLHDDAYQQRLELAYERWEVLVQPYLVPMKTGSLGEDNPAVKHLDLQDDIDRLFNWTYAKPSKVRELLQGMETEVRCYFKPKAPDPRSTGRRQHYELDHGSVIITVQGVSSRLQEGEMPQSAHAGRALNLESRHSRGRPAAAPGSARPPPPRSNLRCPSGMSSEVSVTGDKSSVSGGSSSSRRPPSRSPWSRSR